MRPAREPAHPTPFTYVRVAFILAVITGGEVGLFYVDLAAWAFVFIFFVLSATKFALVALFYMHLRYDARLFSSLFTGGLLLGMAVVVAVLALFGTLTSNPVREVAEAAVAQGAVGEEHPSPTPITTPQATATSQATPPAGIGASVEQGKQVFISAGCGACHAISGLPGAVGTIGPAQDSLASRAASRVAGMSAEEYIRQSIEDPSAYVVEGFAPVMPPLRSAMSDAEFESLVAYLMTLQ